MENSSAVKTAKAGVSGKDRGAALSLLAVRALRAAACLLLFSGLLLRPVAAGAADAGIEFGIEDDLSVFGLDGGALDPDMGIKGFAVFGATQAAYPGAVVGPGNVVINGFLAVSSGTYLVGNSTFVSAGNIFINDGLPGQLLRKSGTGNLYWANLDVLADNMGNHLATTTLNMAGFQIINVASITVIGKDPASGYSLWLSSGIYMPDGLVNAAVYSGSGLLLTDLNASNLTSGTVPLARLEGITKAEISSTAGIEDTQLATILSPGKVLDTALTANVSLLNANQTMTGIKTFASSATVTTALSVPKVQLGDNVAVSSEALADLGGGLRISSNVYIVGFASAAKFFGDGSELTGLDSLSDNLGNHIATKTLNMAYNQIINVASLTVTGQDADSGYSLWLSSGINMAGGRVEAGLYSGNGALLTDLNASNLTSGTVPLARLSGITKAELSATAGIEDTQLATISSPGKVLDGALSSNVSLLDADQTAAGVKTFTSSMTVTGTLGAFQVQLGENVAISSEALADVGGGVRVSTNVYIVGFTSSTKYYGDGSALTGLDSLADNLGNHIATGTLNMTDHQIINVASLTVTGKDADSGYSLWLSSGINMAGGRVEAGLYSGSGALLTDLNASNLASGTVPLARLAGITKAEIASSAGIEDTQLATIATSGKVLDSALTANVSLLNANQTMTGIKTFVSSATVTTVLGVPQVQLAENVQLSSATIDQGAGVYVSSNLYVVGFTSAAKFYGDGSGLYNLAVPGDNLGNHIAGQTLNMADNHIINVASLTITGQDAATGYSLWLSSGINMAGGRVEAGLYAGSGALLTDLNASNLASGTVPLARLSGITTSEIANNAGIHDTQLATIATAGKVLDTALTSNVSLLNADQVVTGVKTYVSSLTVTSALGAPQVQLAENVQLSSATIAQGAGVYVSSNLYVVGFTSAAKFYGDGSGLYNLAVPGDNLGNHIAAQALNMADYQIINVSSLTVTGKDAATGYSVSLSSGLYMPDGRVEAGLYSGSGALLTNLNASNLASGTVPLVRLVGITKTELSATAGIEDTQLATIVSAGKVQDSALSSNVSLLDKNQTITGIKTFASSATVTTVLGAPRVQLADNVAVSSEALADLGGGVRVSSNVYIVGFASATRYYGDGSQLTGLDALADNLGNHVATMTLNMAYNQIVNIDTLTVTGKNAATGYSVSLSSGLYMPDGRVEAGLYSGNGA
ncbi:MAG TPA: hypothetical protein DCZ92_05025, partial [Elusimicrobia bacterium]|nr:hypothetical protein [Elusimicrobiota bacterium]